MKKRLNFKQVENVMYKETPQCNKTKLSLSPSKCFKFFLLQQVKRAKYILNRFLGRMTILTIFNSETKHSVEFRHLTSRIGGEFPHSPTLTSDATLSCLSEIVKLKRNFLYLYNASISRWHLSLKLLSKYAGIITRQFYHIYLFNTTLVVMISI